MNRIDKNYISPIDQQLAEFDKTHSQSKSQQAEFDKYQRIYALRDHSSAAQKSDSFDKFD